MWQVDDESLIKRVNSRLMCPVNRIFVLDCSRIARLLELSPRLYHYLMLVGWMVVRVNLPQRRVLGVVDSLGQASQEEYASQFTSLVFLGIHGCQT